METNKQNLEKLVKVATKKAGDYVKENAFNYGNLDWKHLDDPVTTCDKNAEKIIRDEISMNIYANFVGEEYGINNIESDITVYIDPIDGTKSFIRGEFNSSVSVALEKNGELIVGCVYDFMRGIMYVANEEKTYLEHYDDKGQGHKKNLPLYEKNIFSKYTVSSNDSPEWEKRIRDNPKLGYKKQTGSVALAMAQTAAGSIDGIVMGPYEKGGLTDTSDIAAGYLLLKKTGFKITDIEGKPYNHKNPNNGLIALSGELYKSDVLKNEKTKETAYSLN